jgi:hypothetical protein
MKDGFYLLKHSYPHFSIVIAIWLCDVVRSQCFGWCAKKHTSDKRKKYIQNIGCEMYHIQIILKFCWYSD